MRISHQVIVATMSLLLAGCEQSDREGMVSKPVGDRTNASLSTPPAATGQDSRTLGENIKRDLADTKDAFLATVDKKLQGVDEQFDGLAKKADGYQNEVKDQALKTLDTLREKRQLARQKYDELKQSSNEAWGQFKAELSTVLDDLQKGIEEAKSKLK